MPASLTLTFPHSELPPSTLSLTLEVIDDPDGPEYDFEGTVRVHSVGLRFQYAFACDAFHVERWCKQLLSLVKGEEHSAAFSNASETVSLLIVKAGNGNYGVRATIEEAGHSQVQFVGYSMDSTGSISAVRQLRELIAKVPA